MYIVVQPILGLGGTVYPLKLEAQNEIVFFN